MDLPAEDLQEAGQLCRGAFTDDLGLDLPDDTEPVAAKARHGDALLIYRADDDVATCALQDSPAGWRIDGYSRGPWQDLSEQADADLLFLKYGSPVDTDRVRDVVGAAWVPVNAAAVHIEVGDRSYAALLVDGLALFWLPDGLTGDDVDNATMVLYSHDGALLDSQPL